MLIFIYVLFYEYVRIPELRYFHIFLHYKNNLIYINCTKKKVGAFRKVTLLGKFLIKFYFNIEFFVFEFMFVLLVV